MSMWHETLSRQVLSRGRYLRLLTQRCLSARQPARHRSKAPASTSFAFGGVGGESQRGFTLLLSALVTSIVLALGASIFGIAQKELMLSSIGRDSQFAFYAADTAAECALYWDVRHNYFATTTPPIEPTCDGQVLETEGHSATYPYTVLFQFEPNGYCADVSVSKSIDSGSVRTIVHADGFSTGCAAVATSPRALQRSVEVRF